MKYEVAMLHVNTAMIGTVNKARIGTYLQGIKLTQIINKN